LQEYKGHTYETAVFCAGSDGTNDNTFNQVVDSRNKVTVETGAPLAKLKMLTGEKPRAFLGGVGLKGKPGSVKLFMYPSFQNVQDLQLASDAITDMSLNFEQ